MTCSIHASTSAQFSRWFLQMLPHGLNVDGSPSRPWPTNTSFICISHRSCFPELLQKKADCGFAWRFSSQKVNRKLSLVWVTDFNSKYASTVSVPHIILLLIHWGKNSVLRRWYSWKWKIILEIVRIQKAVTFY